MININKDTANNVILTLTELTTIDSPIYLFSFTSHTTNNNILFIAQDESTATSRYNQFNLIDTGSTYINLSAGTFNLSSGWFSYNVFQQTGSTIDLTLTAGIVESGVGFCNGSPQQLFNKASSAQNFFDYISG